LIAAVAEVVVRMAPTARAQRFQQLARTDEFPERVQRLLSVGQIVSAFQKSCQAKNSRESKIFLFSRTKIAATS
jgi:hypothetical protein